MRGKLRSNLPLRLALAFDELVPKVPILLLLRSQPLQWRSPWAVSASSHRHWTIHRPRGTGADEEVDISPERKKQRNCSRGRTTRTWGKKQRNCSRGRRTRRWGKKQRNCSICSMPLSVRWRRGEGEAILTICRIVFCSLNI